jgi:hypothetical protein
MKHRAFAALALGLALGLPFFNSARADLPASLLEELATPVMRLALSGSPDGRALVERMAGEAMNLRPSVPEIWREQTQRMVDGVLRRQRPGTAEELYLRAMRLNYRFRAEALPDSPLAAGVPRELSAEDLSLVLRLAGEELALREPGLLERLRGVTADLGGRLEFAPIEESRAGLAAAAGATEIAAALLVTTPAAFVTVHA